MQAYDRSKFKPKASFGKCGCKYLDYFINYLK